ncbi:MAG: HAMP domain-containing sensor histidine kinase [Exiguobacterium marinum]|uniref:histidine kinase n=1 Tax=Exiguobacterium marinum TaxID=273528 RepID=A0ABY7WZ47_9BACL|nr:MULTISPECIES: HAMP domain-containing sensor histidine kinase [Exiguobacterium]WDH76148.1 HAMP domain-containing sensor histidine kinase [Exiguobacterium marinum]
MKQQLVIRMMIVVTIVLLLLVSVLSYGTYRYYYEYESEALLSHATTSAYLYPQAQVGFETPSAFSVLVRTFGYPGTDLTIVDRSGSIVKTTGQRTRQASFSQEQLQELARGESVVQDYDVGEEHYLSVTSPIVTNDTSEFAISFTRPLEDLDTLIREIWMTVVIIGVLIWLLALYTVIRIADRFVRPIRQIIETADEMAQGDFDVSVESNEKHELGALARTLTYLGAKVQQHQSTRNEFLSSVSHELRTPLTSIKGWTETIRGGDEKLSEETELGLSIIHSETERMIGLVEQLLDYTKIEESRLVLYRQELDLVSLLRKVTLQLKQSLEDKDITLVERYPQKSVGLFDENRLKQVFLNILENAIRFSPDGGTLTIRFVQSERVAFISIIDEGPGISREHLQRITEMFYQAQVTEGSSGLGLAISKELIEAHEGKLVIESEIGHGTTVTVLLPLDPSELH